jgi:tetratricopeptide (TPR) repeat protein
MRKLIVTALLFTSFVAAMFSGAPDHIGRLLLSAGFPSVAAALIQDPAWKGVALYSERRWAKAADAFRASHAPGSAYNLGNALAQARRYSEAIEAYDEAFAQDGHDEDAQANRSLVAALMEREKANEKSPAAWTGSGAPTRQAERRSDGPTGKADTQSTGPEGLAGGLEPELKSASPGQSPSARGGGPPTDLSKITLYADRARIGKPVDAKSVQANVQWLETLPDEPGRFLKLRLAMEHARRVEAGTAPPITGDPW